MKKIILGVVLLTSQFYSFSQTELGEKAKELVKKEVSNAAKREIINQTGSNVLGELGGEAAFALLDLLQKSAERGKVRDIIKNENSEIISGRIAFENDVSDLMITKDGRFIITADFAGKVNIYSLEDQKLLKSFQYYDQVVGIESSNDGQYICIATTNSLVLLNADLKQISKVRGQRIIALPSTSPVQFHPENPERIFMLKPGKIGFGKINYVIEEYDWKNNVRLNEANFSKSTMTMNPAKAMSMASLSGLESAVTAGWTPINHGLILLSMNQKIFLWDMSIKKEKKQKVIIEGFEEKNKYASGLPVGFISSTEFLVINNDILQVLDPQNWSVKRQKRIGFVPSNQINKVAFNDDKSFFLLPVFTTIDGYKAIEVAIVETKSLEKIASFPGDLYSDTKNFKERSIYDWSGDGKFIVKYQDNRDFKGLKIYDLTKKVSIGGGIQEPETAQPETTQDESSDAYAKLERLKELRDKGVLTEEEFSAQKKKILDKLNED